MAAVREISQNDLRWFGARLSIAIEDIRRFGGMSAHDLKQALRDVPGVETLTMGYAQGGNLLVTIAGRTVEVSPTASNAEIAYAFREAVNTPNVATPLPPAVGYAAAPTRTTAPMTKASLGGFAASLKAMMDEAVAGVEQAKADGLSKVQTAVGKLGDAKTATVRVTDNLADNIEGQAASIMAELGQISNDLG